MADNRDVKERALAAIRRAEEAGDPIRAFRGENYEKTLAGIMDLRGYGSGTVCAAINELERDGHIRRLQQTVRVLASAGMGGRHEVEARFDEFTTL